ncbi:MAG: hypothetical protein J7M39_09040 [Anaerolineae bacterium]|nr:hypothetical protein [Anaerolineae bacterium]
MFKTSSAEMILPLSRRLPLVALARQGLKGILVGVVVITAVGGVVKTLKLMPSAWEVETIG